MYVSGLGKVDNRICIVLEWTPEEVSLLQDRPSLLQLSREHGRLTPDILYETCACIIHTIYLQLHVQFIIIKTLHMINLSLLRHLKIASETPNHQLLGAQGPRDTSHDLSVYKTCACVIHTNLLSYIINTNVCVGYMCFVKL